VVFRIVSTKPMTGRPYGWTLYASRKSALETTRPGLSSFIRTSSRTTSRSRASSPGSKTEFPSVSARMSSAFSRNLPERVMW
jgi:hypothetical protein